MVYFFFLQPGRANPNSHRSTDFYKKLALDCSGQQIAVDLFVLQNQHCDLATISGISKFSGGQVQIFPGFHATQNPSVAERFDRALRRWGDNWLLSVYVYKTISIQIFNKKDWVWGRDEDTMHSGNESSHVPWPLLCQIHGSSEFTKRQSWFRIRNAGGHWGGFEGLPRSQFPGGIAVHQQ